MTTTLLLVRHGYNEAVGVRLAGTEPVPLDDRGRAQADALVTRLARVRIDAIYCSPLARTRQTAAPLAAARGLPAIDLPDVTEFRMGEFDGCRFDALNADPRWTRFCAQRATTRAPEGELMLEVQARVVAGLLRVAEAHPGGSIVVVSHADPIRAAALFFLGAPVDYYHRIDVAPASVTAIALRPEGPMVVKLNDTGDLHGLPTSDPLLSIPSRKGS
jgi:probable phosphoglycerate mutase